MAGHARTPRRRHRRPPRRWRPVLVAMIAVVAVAGAGLGGAFLVTERLAGNVARVPAAFAAVPAADRPPPDPTASTFLLVGTDSRAARATAGTVAAADGGAGDGGAGDGTGDGQRGDAILVARLAADGGSAAVVSIPRDSWVDIPGHGPDKINAAFAVGGPGLLVRTVERLTGLRIDHFGVLDFAGFQQMVDAVGGIDVQVARATGSGGVTFREGSNHLDGAQALAYVRQRHGLPGGDLDRVHRQQNALRALLVAARGDLGDPLGLYALADATSRSVSVDDTLSNGGLRALVLGVRGLRSDAVTFASAPVRGIDREGTRSVVRLDAERGRRLWAAVRAGAAAGWLAENGGDALGAAPN